MKMITLYACTAVLLVTSARSQEAGDGDRFQFNTPAEWRGEVITLPPGFAKDLEWHGTESIRFAPGMFDAKSESFFSYVLAFVLSKDDDLSDEAVKAQVLTYYQGLASAVMGAEKDVTDTFKLALQKSKDGEPAPPPADAKAKTVKGWTGSLDWVEPFQTKAAQTLNFEIHLWENGERPVLYFTVSPQKTDHPIWAEMRKHRALFELK